MADSPQASATADDLLDERLIQNRGFGGYAAAALNRLKGGELGSFPVVIGMIVISIVFYSIEPRFLSSFTLTNIFAFAAPVGLISLGIVLVLLLGEIDLSVGSVSGLAAASMAVLVVNKGASMTMGVVAGILVGLVIGAFYALLYT
ncbi:MAG: sugar ABC transporter permease, partial [Nocardioides sp.]